MTRTSIVGLLSLLFVVLSAGTAAAVDDGSTGTGTGDGGRLDASAIGTDDLVADLVVTTDELDEAGVNRLVADLRALQGVSWVETDGPVDATPDLLVAVDDETDGSIIAAVGDTVDAVPGASGLVHGRVIADAAIADRIDDVSLVAVALVTLAVIALLVWLTGPVQAALAGLSVALAAWLGGTFADQVTGPFDGSIATTPLPATLAAIAVSVWLLFRLLAWFEAPEGDDPAEMIHRAILALGSELIILFSGLAVTALFLELLGPARSIASVILAGAAISALITLAVAVPGLTALAGQAATPGRLGEELRKERRGPRSFLPDEPNVRHFPVGVLVGFGAFLAVLAVLGLQSTPAADLLDERAIAEVQAVGPGDQGDPTNAVVARFPAGTDRLAKTAWLQRVSALPSVGRVDIVGARYVGGAEIEGDESPRVAVVVPTVSGRGEAARALVDAIETADAGIGTELSGAPVDALRANERDRSLLWLSIFVVAVVGAVGVFMVVGDLALAGISAALRILSGASAIGLAQLLSGSVAGAELQLLVLLSSACIGLYEIGFLRRLFDGHLDHPTDDLLDESQAGPGWAAALAAAALVIASMGLIVSDLSVVRRLAIVSIVVLIVEIVIGMWLLRPTVLGVRAIHHLASGPVRSALRALDGPSAGDAADFQRLTVVVSNLLHTEFGFQADPLAADVSRVFVADSPLGRKAADYHENLASAGLRIVGRSPKLRNLRIVDHQSPVTVAVTVDHPGRQLIDAEGRVVGLRRAERRSVMLWMVEYPDGSHRISDSVELGTMPLGGTEAPGSIPAPTVPASIE